VARKYRLSKAGRLERVERMRRMNADPAFASKRDATSGQRIKRLHADPVFAAKQAAAASENMRRLNADPVFIAKNEEAHRLLTEAIVAALRIELNAMRVAERYGVTAETVRRIAKTAGVKLKRGRPRQKRSDPLGSMPPQSRAYPSFRAEDQRTNKEHRLSQLTSVIFIGVIDEKLFTRECITRCLQALGNRFDIMPFATCEDFFQSTESRDLVLYHIHEDASQWHGNNQKALSFKKLLNIIPVIILSDIDNPDTLIEMFESGARGFVPTVNTTLEQVIEIIGLVKVGGTFVSPSSLILRRTKNQSLRAWPASSNQFTPGELAILDRLKLGKANKIIAHELGVSESTVKVHVGRIMKKLNVTNRTQVVCRVYALSAAATLHTGEV
jgi:DNA-binding NarL/FixJ family response regulator